MNYKKDKLIESFNSSRRIGGLTHNFYKYPARFSPDFVRDVILEFTKEGDCIIDAFMGGGTTIVEALANGRTALGVDINPLSYFVTDVKTTPLSINDKEKIIAWSNELDFENISSLGNSNTNDPRLKNLPEKIKKLLIYAVSTIDQLEFPRQRRFARCALLNLGHWAIDNRNDIPRFEVLKQQLLKKIKEMFYGLDELVEAANNKNIPKNKITSRRLIHLGTIHKAIHDPNFALFFSKPKLLLTSPPYPGVHILYHRWQVNGRRETPAPFLISNLWDGYGESYYTLGSRSNEGLKNYFSNLRDIFWTLRQFINPKALVVQLVAFSQPDTQVSTFLDSMSSAGYEEMTPYEYSNSLRPVRRVPNRKWYTYTSKEYNASREILFFHKPRF